jgi:hypothetical protein
MPGYGGSEQQPNAPLITINGGASICYSRSVTLKLQCEGVTEMQIANGLDPSIGAWEPYVVSKAWTLSDVVGTKTVSVRFRQEEPMYSAAATATISYQSGPGSTFNTWWAQDIANVLLGTDAPCTEEITIDGATFSVYWEPQGAQIDDGGGSRMMLETARVVIPRIQVDDPTVGTVVSRAIDSQDWVIYQIQARDIAQTTVLAQHRARTEASAQDGRRK